MRIDAPKRPIRSLREEDGFTLIFAIMIMFISLLLVAGVFVAADGDIKLTSTSTNQFKGLLRRGRGHLQVQVQAQLRTQLVGGMPDAEQYGGGFH